MSNIPFSEMQKEFSKIDFAKIEAIEKELANNRSHALEFISDPNNFMIHQLKGTHLPAGLHFHIQINGDLLPPDIEVPSQQITFSSRIVFHDSFRKEVLDKLAERSKKSSINLFIAKVVAIAK